MHLFVRVSLFIAVGWNLLYANDFVLQKEIALQKDEEKKILVKYKEKEKLFFWRWTLYKNGGLVIHRSYDKIVGQNVLYLRHKNQSFRVELRPKGTDHYNVSYLLVKFKAFDQEKKKALFEIFLSDDKKEIVLEDIKS